MAEGPVLFTRLDDEPALRRQVCVRPLTRADEIRIVGRDSRDVPPGQTGELLARGPSIPRGYFRDPESNARAFTPDGFYRSGKLMWQHPSGTFVAAGHKKDLINRGGEMINASEVEDMIFSHPDVINAACIPVPDGLLGHRMCVCVMLRAGASLDLTALTEFLLGFGTARHRLPERLEIVDSFPLSPMGEVIKKDLVRMILAPSPAASKVPK